MPTVAVIRKPRPRRGVETRPPTTVSLRCRKSPAGLGWEENPGGPRRDHETELTHVSGSKRPSGGVPTPCDRLAQTFQQASRSGSVVPRTGLSKDHKLWSSRPYKKVYDQHASENSNDIPDNAS